MVINTSELTALRADIAKMRKELVETKFGLIPASVQHLEQRVATSTSSDERAVMYSLLVSECSKAKNDFLYIDSLKQRARDMPDDPVSLAELGHTLAILGSQYQDEALDAGYKAIDLAKSQSRQIRNCATSLVRSALLLRDYSSLEQGLRELVDNADQPCSEDIGYEFDFLDQIDTKRCNAELMAKYAALSKRI